MEKEGPSGRYEGEERASDLFELLYSTLHRRAQREMERQPPGHTLQPTALVNEVFLRLGKNGRAPWTDEEHFLVMAARAMRHVLVDHARRRKAVKRDPCGTREPLEGLMVEYLDRATDIEALHVALVRLAEFDPEMARALELRFFAGREMAEIARILGIPKRSLERRWAATRAWLFDQVR